MPKKPQTPEQKAAKAAKERERYNLARKAGLTPDQARSIQKTIQNQPDIIQQGNDLTLALLNRMNKLGDFLTGETKERRTSSKAPPPVSTSGFPNFNISKSGKNQSAIGLKEVGKNPYKRKAVKPKQKRRTSTDKKKRDDAFKRFAKKNPDLSSRELENKWRAKGKSISHGKAQELVRKVRGQEKNLARTRHFTGFHYISPDEVHKEFRKMYHINKRYIYLIRFEVEVEGQPDTFEEYIHISSDEKITNMQDLRQEVIDAWADGQALGRREKYKTKRILLDTITVLYSVDMKKRG